MVTIRLLVAILRLDQPRPESHPMLCGCEDGFRSLSRQKYEIGRTVSFWIVPKTHDSAMSDPTLAEKFPFAGSLENNRRGGTASSG
jgi:hypothetical protein